MIPLEQNTMLTFSANSAANSLSVPSNARHKSTPRHNGNKSKKSSVSIPFAQDEGCTVSPTRIAQPSSRYVFTKERPEYPTSPKRYQPPPDIYTQPWLSEPHTEAGSIPIVSNRDKRLIIKRK